MVHQDHGPAADVGRRPAAAVEALAPPQLLQLPARDRIDQIIGDVQPGYDVVVEHPHAAGRDGAHRQLLVAGHAELAHDEDVERRAERVRHLVRHRHAAARQGQHEHVRAIGVMGELLGELPTRFAAIAKELWFHLSSSLRDHPLGHPSSVQVADRAIGQEPLERAGDQRRNGNDTQLRPVPIG